jgi:hypothetical protein
MSPTCSDCEKSITHRNKSGRCRACCVSQIHSPEAIAKRTETIRRLYSTPEMKAKLSAAAKLAGNRPEVVEKKRAAGKRNWHLTLGGPKAKAALATTETRAKLGNSISRTLIAKAGIPYERREEYIGLLKSGFKRDEAREIILADIARPKKPLSPFERQMEALNRGAGLTEKLNLSRGYDYTLAGGSPL